MTTFKILFIMLLSLAVILLFRGWKVKTPEITSTNRPMPTNNDTLIPQELVVHTMNKAKVEDAAAWQEFVTASSTRIRQNGNWIESLKANLTLSEQTMSKSLNVRLDSLAAANTRLKGRLDKITNLDDNWRTSQKTFNKSIDQFDKELAAWEIKQ